MAKKDEKKSKLEEKLTVKKESSWKKIKPRERKRIFDYCEGYKNFLTEAKTERMATKVIISFAESRGFKPIEKMKRLRPGNKVFMVNKNKSIALAVVGQRPAVEGMNIIASHIDAPRLDLKQNPLYQEEDSEVALFKTHYYGGIKKYQWVNCPLALYGKVILRNGKAVEIEMGKDDGEPAFVIPDLLPHLARKVQGDRKLFDGLEGEELNILVGHIPIDDEKAKERLKLNVLAYLNKSFGMEEEDFVSAEFEAVPAAKARDVGFDEAMVGSYGQDDRACAYTSLTAIGEIKKPRRTCIALFFDKEEIGSAGNTAVQSKFLEIFVSRIIEMSSTDYKDGEVRIALSRSKSISADVEGALDPSFKQVHEKRNAAVLGRGIVITKYTGARGKYMASDANAEYVGQIRRLFNEEKIPWQAAELGKVDEGGGGTVARYLAEHNMDVLDCGPCLLSMHSPFEISSKADIYTSFRAYTTFFNSDLQS